MKCDVWDIRVEEYGLRNARISMSVPKVALQNLSATDKNLEVSITRKKKKRSMNANSYCWVICDNIAAALNDGSTKEEVYRQAIEAVGKFEPYLIRPEAVEDLQRRWSKNGLGWIVKDTGIELSGYRQVFIYYGSSSYNTEEMARLIDYLINEAESLGLDVLTQNEKSLMLSEWQ